MLVPSTLNGMMLPAHHSLPRTVFGAMGTNVVLCFDLEPIVVKIMGRCAQWTETEE